MAKKTITLFYGGDTNIGRRMNFRAREVEPFVNMEEMQSADIRLVNLECVIATKGQQGSKNPGTSGPFYLRARPEQTNILVNANIDIVLTANNHAGDYGRQALLEELEYLDAAGILHAGSGKNFSEAFKPVYKRVNDITVAIFSVDSTWKPSAATLNRAGTAYLSRTTPKLWEKFFAEKIRAAHEKAHVVIVAAHWGSNYIKKPGKSTQALARIFIDLGADAVLGCHAHKVHGVETYKNRPIIYDAGDLLFDTSRENGYGCFTLEISADGVEKVKFIPLTIGYGQTSRAVGRQAELSRKNFVKLCNDFKTATTTQAGNVVEISFTPPPRQSKILNDFAADIKREKTLIEPLAEPRPEWIVDSVPEEAIITPQRFGALKMIGYYVAPEYRTITERTTPYVETYWTIDEPVDEDYRLSIRGVPIRECNMKPFGAEPAHEFLDYMFPINRWKPGVIYRERYGLHPPAMKELVNVDLRVTLQVFSGEKILGEFTDPALIKLRVPERLWYETEFDDVICQFEPEKFWTAEQLAKVTRGKWIVPPPKDWHVNSFSRLDGKIQALMPRPTLFLALKSADEDSHAKILEHVHELDGATVTHAVKGLPKNFPLLKVDSILRATFELGIAARKRFQGKVIAITGDADKIATCEILRAVLSKNHNVSSTLKGANQYLNIPWAFAQVKPHDDYAIVEMALTALNRPRGSITCDITPNVAVVTSLAKAANESPEVAAKYERRIFCGMTPGSFAIINRDMPHYELFAEKAKSFKLNVITFGTHSDAAIRMPVLAKDAEFYVADKTYKLSCPDEKISAALAVVGISIAIGFSIDKTLEIFKTM